MAFQTTYAAAYTPKAAALARKAAAAQPSNSMPQEDLSSDFALACALDEEINRNGACQVARPAPQQRSTKPAKAGGKAGKSLSCLPLPSSSKNNQRHASDKPVEEWDEGDFDAALNSIFQNTSFQTLSPKVNSSVDFPAQYVNEDRSRLTCRLEMYGLTERQVKGDGNCQFSSLSDQLYGNSAHHHEVSRAVAISALINRSLAV